MEKAVFARLEQQLRRELYGGSVRANEDGVQMYVAEGFFERVVDGTLPWIKRSRKSAKDERFKDLAAQWQKQFGEAYRKKHAGTTAK